MRLANASAKRAMTRPRSVAKHTQIKDQDDTSISAAMVQELHDDNEIDERGMKPADGAGEDNVLPGWLHYWTDMAEERVCSRSNLLK
jgi:hypothetical protein